MTAEEIIHEVLALLKAGKMAPDEALCRLIAAGLTSREAESRLRMTLLRKQLTGPFRSKN